MISKLGAFRFLLVLGGVMISSCSRFLGNPTEDWNSYQNEVYGYSFKYPSDCFYGPMPSDCKEKPPEERRAECLCFLNAENPDQVFMQKFLGEADALILAGFSVNHIDSPMYSPPEGTDLISWLNQNFSEMFEDIPDEPNMDFNGVPAVRIYSPGSPMSPSGAEIYYIQDDLLFRIQMLEVDLEDNQAFYDQILSTFRLGE